MTKKTFQTAFVAVALALVSVGCNSFENPYQADVATSDTATQDNGADQQSADVSTSVDAGNDASTDTATVPDTAQAVEVSQEVTTVVAECKTDADCNDNNACTADVCVVGAKCSHLAIAAKCDDNNACTDNDTCEAGACKGTTKSCDDNNVCTDDFCIGGKCVHGVNSAPCDDGNACTDKDTCDGAKCAGTTVVCDDNNPCTTDTCDTIKGCTFAPVVCEDNDPCTDDTCDPKVGYCMFAQKVCDDGKPYTYDFCDFDGWYGNPGQCVSEQKWNACGKDSDCEDGNKCTINVCDSIYGTCKTVYENCNDYNPCTTDSCVPAKGCVVMVDSCDDNNPNTTDSCSKYDGSCTHTPITTPPVVVPPTSGSTTKIEITCGAVACEPHLYFGQQAGGTAFDVYGVAPANGWYVVDVPKSQLSIWGLEVAARLTSATWPWFGCDSTAPGLETLIVKINGVVAPGATVKHPWVCQGAGQGNLAWPLTLFK